MGLYDVQQQMYKEALKSETLFADLAEQNGYACHKSNYYEDKYQHWDYEVSKNGKWALVEVKSNKEIQKKGYTWLEFQTVDGRIGWMLGKADVIAIERDDCFELYHRETMREFAEKNMKGLNGFVFHQPENPVDIMYQRYRRPGRLDISIVVPFKDIEKFIVKKIYK